MARRGIYRGLNSERTLQGKLQLPTWDGEYGTFTVYLRVDTGANISKRGRELFGKFAG